MSKEIRTIVWCDGAVHRDEQEEAAVTRRFVIDDYSKQRELDLCEACDKELVQPLLDLLKENGQPITTTKTAPDQSPQQERRSTTRHAPEIRCPVEECDWMGTLTAGKQHTPKFHGGESLGVLEGRLGRRNLDGSRTRLEFRCRECEAAFDTRGSVTAHKTRTHS